MKRFDWTEEVAVRGRRFASKQDIERHIANGFGSGAGAGYVPWLHVQDVPSMGRSHKIQGVKIDRIHHLLSDLERAYLLVCEFSEEVVDIREQFPLLPVESTLAIAKAIGVRYPRYKTTAIPLVMTTDFLLTVKQPNGDFESVARTIKYQQDLDGKDSVRTLEKLEIERRFWMSQDVDWIIVTEEFFTPDLIKNLGILRRYAQLPRALMDSSLHSQFIEALEACKAYPWSTSEWLMAKLRPPASERPELEDLTDSRDGAYAEILLKRVDDLYRITKGQKRVNLGNLQKLLPTRLLPDPATRKRRFPLASQQAELLLESVWHFRLRRVILALADIARLKLPMNSGGMRAISSVPTPVFQAYISFFEWDLDEILSDGVDPEGLLKSTGVSRDWSGPPGSIGNLGGNAHYRKRPQSGFLKSDHT